MSQLYLTFGDLVVAPAGITAVGAVQSSKRNEADCYTFDLLTASGTLTPCAETRDEAVGWRNEALRGWATTHPGQTMYMLYDKPEGPQVSLSDVGAVGGLHFAPPPSTLATLPIFFPGAELRAEFPTHAAGQTAYDDLIGALS